MSPEDGGSADWRDLLAEQGWEVVTGPYLSASRVSDSSAWNLVLAPGGRFRLTSTTPLGPPLGRRLRSGGRSFRWVSEDVRTITVAGRLETPAELAGLLATLEGRHANREAPDA